MNAAPTLPMPAKSPLALSKAGAAAAVFQSAIPKVTVPITMATLGRIFCQVQKLSLDSVASVSTDVFASGVALVSRGASTDVELLTRASALTVIGFGVEPRAVSTLAVLRSTAALLEERALFSIGRSSAESSLRSELRVFGKLDRLNASLVLFSMPRCTDRRVAFASVVKVSLGVEEFEENPDGILKALVKLILLFSVVRESGCVQEK